MDFDSPDVAKEFPGLYMGDAGKTLNDPAEYEEDEKTKKKKDKKDSKKDKGYATLAGESSHEEDELDPKSPGKAKKIKASFKLSAKKKDKSKSLDKEKPEKERKNSDKEKEKVKKVEKSKSSEKEDGKSDKKSLEKEKIHLEKETKHEKVKEKDKKSHDKEKSKSKSSDEKEVKDKDKKEEKKKKKLSIGGGGGDKEVHLKALTGSVSPSQNNTTTTTEKEKGLNLNQALNAFLNAPAPLLSKHRKEEHKKEKEGGSASSKVKLKLKRSKNSLEDSQSSQSDISFAVSHQFPEEPEAIVKEIRKYEALLEQTHSHMKSSKKVSKKSEEQLWELQRTLTQLKRKLRSINALSVGLPASLPTCPQPIPAALLPPKTEPPAAAPAAPVPTPPAATPAVSSANTSSQKAGEEKVIKYEELTSPVGVVPAAPSKPESSSSTTIIPDEDDDDMKFDFTLKTITAPATAPAAFSPPNPDNSSNSVVHPLPSNGTMSPLQQAMDLNPVSSDIPSKVSLSPNVLSDPGSSSSNFNSLTPEPEVERLQVEVQVHAEQSLTPTTGPDLTDSNDDRTNIDTPDFNNGDCTLSASVIKTLTFSDDDEDDDDDNEEITDVSSLSLRNTNVENENSFLDEDIDLTRSKISQATVSQSEIIITNPFEMPIFETEEYLALENEALIFFNEELQDDIAREEAEIEELMQSLEQMREDGFDIDAPEVDLDLDHFEFDELVSLWQITKLENEALHEQVNHLRQLVAVGKLEEFRLETRYKYLDGSTPKAQEATV